MKPLVGVTGSGYTFPGMKTKANQLQTDIAPDAGGIIGAVIKRLENPALPSSVVHSTPTLEKGFVTGKPAKREAPKRVASNKGKPRNRYAKAWATLSPEDREDVAQAVSMVLARHEFYSPGGWVIGTIPKAVWVEIYSEARKACRIDRKHERNAIRFEALPIGDAVALLSEGREHCYLTRDRAAIAQNAKAYKAMIDDARDKQRAAGNRKWKSNHARALHFLKASLGVALHDHGWGDYFPDMPTDQKSAHDFRTHALRTFKAYIRQGQDAVTLRSFEDLSLALLS